MKLTSICLLIVWAASCVVAQDSSSPAKKAERATIEGIVTRDPDSQPVKKVLIELIAENQSEAGNYTAVTGAEGEFRIEGILPGRYRLFAERVGLLDTGRNRVQREGRVLSLAAGQELKDVHLRLQAAAVIRGRVTDEDGDPLAECQVTALRQTFAAGHMHWEQVGAERTNDLGEYRVANLAAGNIYVSVSPPPDFKSLIESGGSAAGERLRREEKPNTSYQTTYYPGTSDRSQATPVQLHAGDDFPVNFSLTAAPSLSIRGSVVNLPPRTMATIMLQSRDFGLVQSGTEVHKDGSFVIRDVSPGSYTILASVDGSAVPMTARQFLRVGSANIDGLRLSPQPGATVRGHLRLESKGGVRNFDPTRMYLSLQAAAAEDEASGLVVGDRYTNLAHLSADGSFEWKDVPAGNYYVQLMGESGANEDWFVKSVLAGGREVNDTGLIVSGGAVLIDLLVSANGGVADGVVVDEKGSPVENAIVVAVPEARFRGRTDRYLKTVSDQSGRFSLHGIRPGDYTVFAWETVDGEAYFNPDFLKSYEGLGNAMKVSEGMRTALQLKVIPGVEELP
jgi:protocatechuate 3,4-dioxygenase beta subunit